jgi:hypothetical protein
MKKRFVYGLGFCFFPTKNSFRERMRWRTELDSIFLNAGTPKIITPSIETDMC